MESLSSIEILEIAKELKIVKRKKNRERMYVNPTETVAQCLEESLSSSVSHQDSLDEKKQDYVIFIVKDMKLPPYSKSSLPRAKRASEKILYLQVVPLVLPHNSRALRASYVLSNDIWPGIPRCKKSCKMLHLN